MIDLNYCPVPMLALAPAAATRSPGPPAKQNPPDVPTLVVVQILDSCWALAGPEGI